MNSLPKTVTRQRRSCDLNPGPFAPESSTLTTRLLRHPPRNAVQVLDRPRNRVQILGRVLDPPWKGHFCWSHTKVMPTLACG